MTSEKGGKILFHQPTKDEVVVHQKWPFTVFFHNGWPNSHSGFCFPRGGRGLGYGEKGSFHWGGQINP